MQYARSWWWRQAGRAPPVLIRVDNHIGEPAHLRGPVKGRGPSARGEALDQAIPWLRRDDLLSTNSPSSLKRKATFPRPPPAQRGR